MSALLWNDVIKPGLEAAGDFLQDKAEDVVDIALNTGDDVTKFLGLGSLPSDVSQELLNLYKGPLRDFFRTAVGRVIARAFATLLYYNLAPLLGPQLAAVAFAFPGLLRGEKFDEAWATEFIWRVTTTAGILAGMAYEQYNIDAKQAFPPGTLPDADIIKKRLDEIFSVASKLKQLFPNVEAIDVLGFDYAATAQQFGVRQDVVLEALSLYTRKTDALKVFCSDIASGNITKQCTKEGLPT